MTTPNTLRRLNWLWKHRHTHDGDTLQEQITVIRETIERDADLPPQHGAHVHLTRSISQTIAVGGEPIEWDTQYAVFDPLAFDVSVPTTTVEVQQPGYYDVEIAAGWDSFTGGGTLRITRDSGGAEVTVWPPSSDPDLWTSTDGKKGSWLAPAIPFELGDLLRVYIDANDASTQDLASATLGFYLVEGIGEAPLGSSGASCPTLGSAVTVSSSGNHDAFPGFVVADDGTYVVAYREGTGHTSADGVIKVRTSSNQGDTWSAASTVLSDGSWDYRGASLTKLADGTLVMAVGARTSGSVNVTDGGFTLTSSDHGASWGSETRIDDGGFTGFSRAEGPVLELSNGDWLLPVYGRNSGQTFTRTRVVRSSDDGANWGSPVDVADGPGDSRRYNESGMIRLGSTVVILIREGESTGGGTIWRSVSLDNGVSWSDPSAVITDDANGCPKPTLRANGDMVVVLRHGISAGSNYPARLHRSSDLGVTWEACETFPNPLNGNVYGQTDEDGGKLALVRANEDDNESPSTGVVYFHREA